MRRQFDDLDPVLQDPMYPSRFEDPGPSIHEIMHDLWDTSNAPLTDEETTAWEKQVTELKEKAFQDYFPIMIADVNAYRKHSGHAPLNQDQIESMRAIERHNRGLK